MAVNIPGQDLVNLGIRIMYGRDEKGGLKTTLAWRRSEDRIHFGIARYNPNDRVLEKIPPTKVRGRNEAIEKLYDAEKLMYDSKDCFCLDESGMLGSCDDGAGFEHLMVWFSLWSE
jgi:hypothetical protein